MAAVQSDSENPPWKFRGISSGISYGKREFSNICIVNPTFFHSSGFSSGMSQEILRNFRGISVEFPWNFRGVSNGISHGIFTGKCSFFSQLSFGYKKSQASEDAWLLSKSILKPRNAYTSSFIRYRQLMLPSSPPPSGSFRSHILRTASWFSKKLLSIFSS